MKSNSDYKERFLRHEGILSCRDQTAIKKTSIAIGGLGLGVSIFINLVRMGFEKFHVADPDIYERSNINRQRAAKESTLNKRKDESLLDEARDINPDIQVKVFPEGVKAQNVESFLEGVDWAVDVIDVFALKEKILFNRTAKSKGVPVASCGAMGFCASVVIFNSHTPSFEELTGMEIGKSYQENIKNFVDFLAPEIPFYMQEQMSKAMQGNGSIPFIVSGVEATAAACAAEIMKHVVKLGHRPVAPSGVFIDLANLRIEVFQADYRARSAAPLKRAA
ncbi:MAG: ThiF family adenylyltransferase [Bacteriovoracaceae bacterium]